MTNFKNILIKKDFIGRQSELEAIQEISKAKQAHIVIVYGRRRVGKTELIEQAFRQRNVLKFEGLEGQGESVQMEEVMRQLSLYAEQPLLAKISVTTWQEVLQHIADLVKTGIWTVYFEELQWLADYKNNFSGALKYVWDNHFRHNEKLLIILCGSSPSFMIKEIVHSKALYNRSTYEMAISKLNLLEVGLLLNKKSRQEVMDAYLTVGGVPEYLQWLREDSSIFLSLCRYAFKKNSLFVREYDKIFVSSLSGNPNYKKTIEFLSKKHFASRQEITKHLKISSGGSLTKILDDLCICGFITKYAPYNLNNDSSLVRYCIDDEYLRFYYHFIKPIASRIQAGEFDQDPTHAISIDRYYQWLGYSFERFCCRNYRVIVKALGFYGVDFKVGPYFSRATNKGDLGYQIDLLFERKDRVYTICEIKYYQGRVGTKVVEEFERKLALFDNKKNYTIQRVLITNVGADEALINRAYFDRILTFDDIFEPRYWS